MNEKYIQFYMSCIESGILPDHGLCSCHGIDENRLSLFQPIALDLIELRSERKPVGYWANGETIYSQSNFEMSRRFTPLRQTIVLFMAMLNDKEVIGQQQYVSIL